MPWEVTIRRAKDEPLGVRDDVVNRISTAIPGITWIEEPPLLEQIKDMPDHPFHALIPTWPEETRASFSRSKLLGDYEADEFSAQLYGFESNPLKTVHLEIRGEGNPLPLIAGICVPNGWIAVDDSTNQPLDLASEAASAWDKFREYRDRVIRDHVEKTREKKGVGNLLQPLFLQTPDLFFPASERVVRRLWVHLNASFGGFGCIMKSRLRFWAGLLVSLLLVGFAIFALGYEIWFGLEAASATATVETYSGRTFVGRGKGTVLHEVDGQPVRATLRSWFLIRGPGEGDHVAVLYLPGEPGRVVMDSFMQRYGQLVLPLGLAFAAASWTGVFRRRVRQDASQQAELGKGAAEP